MANNKTFVANKLMQTLHLVFLVLITKLFLTLVPIAIKYTQANIWTIGIFRLTIACLFFGLLAKKTFWSDYKKVWSLGPLFFIHWITYFVAVKTSTPSTAVIGLSSYGIVLLIYSRFVFRTPITPLVFASILLALTGTFLIVENFSFSDKNLQGLCWGMTSALVYAILPIIHQKNPLVPTRHKALSQFLGAFFIFLLIGIPQSNWQLAENDYLSLAYLAIGGTILGHGLWIRVTEKLSTTTTSSIYYLAIPFAMLLEKIILNIEISPRKYLGTLFILMGNILILYLRKKPSPDHAQKKWRLKKQY